jgi:hypothetical protein
MPRFRKMAGYKTPGSLAERAGDLDVELPFGTCAACEGLSSYWTFTDPSLGERRIANRFTILPMEGWDGSEDGSPTERVRRR